MPLSKNQLKYLSSLKIKKFRDAGGQFIVEGDKIVRNSLLHGSAKINLLLATESWLKSNQSITGKVKEIFDAGTIELAKVSSFETPPQVIALLDIPEYAMNVENVSQSLSIGLDSIQDPGNLGTIIRTADWFGIDDIFCTAGCADIYNPKVIQASMGAILNVKIHYVDLRDLLKQLYGIADYEIAGTFMQGIAVNEIGIMKTGMVLFGNESRGISTEYIPFLHRRITIPSGAHRDHVESLNVASSVSIVLNRIIHL